MELSKIDRNIPIKAIPEQELNKLILTDFSDWLSSLLSLSGETSANRLEMALISIKEHCWSMGFAEIKKMLEMYADGKLSIKPIPNYFDRILFGQIVQAYRAEKKPKLEIQKPKEMTEEEKKIQAMVFTLTVFEHYKTNKTLFIGSWMCLDYLIEWQVMPNIFEPKYKNWINKKIEDAVILIKKDLTIERSKTTDVKRVLELKNIFKEVEERSHSIVVFRTKELIFMDYCLKLIGEKKELKTYLW